MTPLDFGMRRVDLQLHIYTIFSALLASCGAAGNARGEDSLKDHPFRYIPSKEAIVTLRGDPFDRDNYAVSRDGKLIAVGGRHSLSAGGWSLWQLSCLQHRESYPLTGGCHALCFNPDGSAVLAGGDAGILTVQPLKEGAKPVDIEGHLATINEIVLSSDGKCFISSADDGLVFCWDATTYEPLRCFRFGSAEHKNFNKWVDKDHLPSSKVGVYTRPEPVIGVYGIAVHPSKPIFALCVGTNEVLVFSMESGKLLDSIQCKHLKCTAAVSYSQDGRYLAVGQSAYGGLVEIRDFDGKDIPRKIEAHITTAGSLRFSPDGRQLLTGSWVDGAKLWSLPEGRPIRHHCRTLSYLYGLSSESDRPWSGFFEVLLTNLGVRKESVRLISYLEDGK